MDLEALKAEVSVGQSRPLDPDRLVGDLRRYEQETHQGGAGLQLTTTNLVIGCSTPEDARGVGAELAEIAVEFPCRVQVAVFDPEAEDGGLVAWASVACHSSRRSQLCCSQVVLYCPGPGGLRIPSLVRATLRPELPTLIYWRGDPPFGTDLLEQFLEPTDQVVFDSSCFPGSARMQHVLSLVSDRYHQEQAFSDLSWGRLEAWREEVATLFDPPDALPCLGSLEEVTVEYRPGGEGVPPQPLLLAGWLASRLGWREAGSEAGSEAGRTGLTARVRGGGGLLDLRLLACPERQEVAPGEICEFHCRTRGGRDFRVERPRGLSRPPREPRGCRPLDEASRRHVELLGREFAVPSRDPVYQEALAAGLELLPSREVARR